MLKIKEFKELLMSKICGEVEITEVTETIIRYKLSYSDWEYDFEYNFSSNLRDILGCLSDDIQINSSAMVNVIEQACAEAENILYHLQEEVSNE